MLRPLRSVLVYTSCTVAFAWLLIGCATSHVCREGNLPAQVLPGDAVVFLLDPESSVVSLEDYKFCKQPYKSEEKIVEAMSKALNKIAPNVGIISPAAFRENTSTSCCTVAETERLLQNAQFKDKIEPIGIHYIVIVVVVGEHGEWQKKGKGYSDSSGAVGYGYTKQDIVHTLKAAIFDAKKGEVAAALKTDCSTSHGWGAAVAGGASGGMGFCCCFPFGWPAGDSEDAAIKDLAGHVAAYLAGQDAAVPCSSVQETEKSK